VLRLLGGEELDAVSRESWVPAHELDSRKLEFLEQGTLQPIASGMRVSGSFTERGDREKRRANNDARFRSLAGPGPVEAFYGARFRFVLISRKNMESVSGTVVAYVDV
jgi:hypothetical protein